MAPSISHPSWRKQLILAASLFVVGSAAYWLEFTHKPKQEEKEEAAKKVFALKDLPVEQLRIQNGTKMFGLKCLDLAAKLCKPGDNSKWELTEPALAQGIRADDANANALLSAINNLASTETIDLKDETPEKRAALLKEYGLDPQARATVDSKKIQAGATTAYLGLAHPIGEGIFAVTETAGKVDDSKVYLLPSYFKTNLDHDLTYWRDKKIVPYSGAEIAAFELEGSKGKVAGVKKDGQWTLNGQLSGDFENIDSLLSAAAFLQARDFLLDEKPLAGAKKVLTLKLSPEGTKKPLLLTFFEKAKSVTPPPSTAKLFAKTSELSAPVELERSVKDRLDKGVQDLRLSKLLTSVERYSVRRLEFSGKSVGATPLILLSSENKWLFEPGKTEANRDQVQAFLEKISGNRIKEFLADGKFPPGEELGIRVRIGDDKDSGKRQLVFWKGGTGGKELYARDLLSKRKEAYRVDPAIIDDLPWTREHFAAPTTVPPPAAPIVPAKKAG